MKKIDKETKILKKIFFNNWKEILKELWIRDIENLPNDYYIIRKSVFREAKAHNFLVNKRTSVKSIYESWKIIFWWKERREDIKEEEFYEKLKEWRWKVDKDLLILLDKQIRELRWYIEGVFKCFLDYMKNLGVLRRVIMFPIEEEIKGLITFYEKKNRRTNIDLMIIVNSWYSDYYCYWDEIEDFLNSIARSLGREMKLKEIIDNIK